MKKKNLRTVSILGIMISAVFTNQFTTFAIAETKTNNTITHIESKSGDKKQDSKDTMVSETSGASEKSKSDTSSDASKIITENQTQTVQLTVSPSGDTSERRTKELRQFKHSDLEPTGLYVKKGDNLEITVKNAENTKVFLGQYGKYADFNSGEETYISFDLHDGENEITMPNEIGQVYIQNFSEEQPVEVTITGGRNEPIYRLGETTDQEFFDSLEKYSDAPFFELVGDYVFGTYQMKIDKEFIEERTTILDLVKHLDQVFLSASEVRGLYVGDSNLGINQKSTNRIQILTFNTGNNAAYAWDDYIVFNENGQSIKSLLRWQPGDDLWGIYHEIGHTFQNVYAMWDSDKYTDDYPGYSLTEVTVNIVPIYLNHLFGIPGRIESSAKIRENIKKFVSGDNQNKDFDTGSIDPEVELIDSDTSIWEKIGMYNQLMIAYGYNVFAYVNQLYRVDYYSGIKMPKTNEEKRQYFMEKVSEATKRNLVDYFEDWGLHPNNQTKEYMAQYDKPAVKIEENLWPEQDEPIVDYELADFQVPVATTKEHVPFTLGVLDDFYNLNDLIEPTSIKNMPSNQVFEPAKVEINVVNDLLKNSKLNVKITNQQSVTTVVPISIDKNYGNALSLTGNGDSERAIFTLQKNTKTIESFTDVNNTSAFHSSVDGTYVTFTLYDKSGNKKKESSCNGEDSPQKFIKELSNVSYEDGDYIELATPLTKKLQSYTDGEIDVERSTSKETEFFQIKNDKFVHLSQEELSPKVVVHSKEITLSDELPSANDFIESISGIFGTDQVEVSLKDNLTNMPGEQKVTLVVKDELTGAKTTEETSLKINYGNAASIWGSPTSERIVFALKNNHINSYVNESDSSAIRSDVADEYVTYKLTDMHGTVKKEASCKGTEAPQAFSQEVDGVRYENGDILTFTTAINAKIQSYRNNDIVVDHNTAGKEVSFKLIDQAFVLYENDENALWPSDYQVGSTSIKGMYQGDIVKAKLIINGNTISQGGTFEQGDFSYYCGNNIKKGDSVVLEGYDGNQQLVATTPIAVEEEQMSLSNASYRLGSTTIQAEYKGNIKKARLIIDGQVVSAGGTLKDGILSYYVQSTKIKSDSKVLLQALDATNEPVGEATEVSLILNDGQLKSAVKKLNSTLIEGTYSGQVTAAKLLVNGEQISKGGTFKDGSFTYYVGTKEITPTDSVELIGLDSYGNTCGDPKTVEIETEDYSVNQVSYTIGESTINGNFTGSIVSGQLTVDGEIVSRGGTFKDGCFSYYIKSDVIKNSNQLVTLNFYDEHNNLAIKNQVVAINDSK